jgi:hypothetical protein
MHLSFVGSRRHCCTPAARGSSWHASSNWSIRNWAAQAERNAGRRDGDLTTAEREERDRLRHENRQRRLERKIYGL